ncbi:E3 ubiquitin-protein ligase RNF14 isoform X1 [Solenopsis invicta]|uniref:E3 ubiquitin-protein ligase RNF14 isoform X1 n=1 Tax=Solenopsis invicta TaxID=13686 RepID=UPI00193CADF9|nr:E3 ubiquitin-protein ligase RNF14 isoform X1 [Solenopsis invicta]XP_039308044.1 E3 ubiquitin-protein ligase RNF14 isoform X1 [Solenopsis invicta]XP_039308045.1 E3 ubiquitin-protein ligase RNF14 isoform X1 [Solenopsis invicta]
MSCDIKNNIQRQEDELVALSSIYDETEFFYVKGERMKCSINIYPKLLRKLEVKLTSDCSYDSASGNSFLVEHLPPIRMYITLPNTYPSKTSPNFHLSIIWLTPWDISFICQKLDEIWKENEGNEIIFQWLNFLQNDIYDFLNIWESLDISYLNLMHTSRNAVTIRLAKLSDCRAQNGALLSDIKRLLIRYDKEQHKAQFYKNIYTCHICFEEYVGTNCIELENCGHIYCRGCMEQHTRIKINEYNNDILCPTIDCKRKMSPNDIKTLCPDLFSQYEDIMLRVTLDTMDDMVYCPQISCQYPVIRNPNDDTPICPICNYCFCIYCRKMYHGQEPCEMTSAETIILIEKYKNSNDKEKKMLEKKYGKRQMQSIEKYLTTEYLQDNTKNCPKCHSFVSKSEGCNKIQCIHCNAQFCWLCNEQIHGYEHFNSPGNLCYGLLFEGMEVNDVIDEIENLNQHFEDFDI